jgi:hypothetical protein
MALVALLGCGDGSHANVGTGGHGGGKGGTGGSGGGAAGSAGGASGTGGSAGITGTAGTGGSTGGTGGGGGATGGTGGNAGGGSGGRGGAGGTAGTGGTGGTGGSTGGIGGATGGTGGGAAGTGGTGGTAGGAAGTGGTGGGTGGAAGTGGATGGTGGQVSCALPPTDGGAGGSPGPLPDSITFVPNVTVATLTGGANDGATNGAPGVATFSNPVNVAVNPAGGLIVADYDNNLLRAIAANDATSTLTTQPGFSLPFGLVFAGSTLYAQTDNNTSGVHNTISGMVWRIDTGTGLATAVGMNLGRPRGLGALSDGRLVLGDNLNQRVLLLDPTTGNATNLAGLMGCPGSATGTGTDARFVQPYGVVVLAGNRIIVADNSAHLLREISVAGVVTAFAGDGVSGTIDGPRATARFVQPRSIAADASGAVFVTDPGAHRIRRIAADGTVTTVAGDGVAGYMEGAGNVAEFFGQEGIAVSADGKTVYVADGTGGSDDPVPYHRIRKITIGP